MQLRSPGGRSPSLATHPTLPKTVRGFANTSMRIFSKTCAPRPARPCARCGSRASPARRRKSTECACRACTLFYSLASMGIKAFFFVSLTRITVARDHFKLVMENSNLEKALQEESHAEYKPVFFKDPKTLSQKFICCPSSKTFIPDPNAKLMLDPTSSCTAGNHDDGSKYYYKIEPVDKTTKTTVEPVDNFCCYDLPETNKC